MCSLGATLVDKKASEHGNQIVFSTDFFDIIARPMPCGSEPHYSLRTADYVTVLAVTTTGSVPMVRQFRPAVDCTTLELPSGHVDPGETPKEAARRELEEETGYRAGRIQFLGALKSDTGRLGNRLHCFSATDLTATDSTPHPDEGIERVELRLEEMIERICNNEFDHALNLSVLLLAQVRGVLPPKLFAPGALG